jgi:hypothetical protein
MQMRLNQLGIFLIGATGMGLFVVELELDRTFSPRAPALYSSIVQNLRVIDSQERQWATEREKHSGDTPSPDDLAPYFQNGNFPPSVFGETYQINPVGQQPTATVHSRLSMGKMTIEAGGVITIPDK